MKIEVGDWVKTSTGKIGTVASINRPNAYVDIKLPPQAGIHYISVVLSELTKIDPPDVGLSPAD
jgi:hypothetical protein